MDRLSFMCRCALQYCCDEGRACVDPFYYTIQMKRYYLTVINCSASAVKN
jgi:hypothetical protein